MAFELKSTAGEMLAQFRKRLTDDTPSRPAFTLHLSDRRARDATIELRRGRLTTSIVGSNKDLDLNLDLGARQYDSVGDLIDAFGSNDGRFSGYDVVPDASVDMNHSSLDLRIQGFGDLLEGGVTISHRRFSDLELQILLEEATKRHNTSYQLSSVPQNEHIFVLQLAQAEALRVLATNAVKRRGLEQSVEDLISLCSSYERAYREDIKRQRRAIPVAKIKDSDVGSGNVVQGRMYRRSLRTGYEVPIGIQPPPEDPALHLPADEDCEDNNIRLTWDQAKDYDFYAYELWRDTDEQNLARIRASVASTPRPVDSIADRLTVTTSKLVFQSFGANSNFDTVAFSAFILESGQTVQSFIDGYPPQNQPTRATPPPLEPETTYFYRLFVQDLNFKIVSSTTVQGTTKALRARFTPGNTNTPVSGTRAGGTTVTLNGERFGLVEKVKIGDKFVDFTLVSPTVITFVTPALDADPTDDVPFLYDLVLYSKDGQRDIAVQAWTYENA